VEHVYVHSGGQPIRNNPELARGGGRSARRWVERGKPEENKAKKQYM
jgi:hypothetical protein